MLYALRGGGGWRARPRNGVCLLAMTFSAADTEADIFSLSPLSTFTP
jgi:hypothetical protein